MSTIGVKVLTVSQVTPVQGVAIKVDLVKSDNSIADTKNVAAPYEATFSNVQDGTGYTVKATTVDINGAAIGDAVVSSAFDVVTPVTPTTQTVVASPEPTPTDQTAPAYIYSDIPSSISVSVGP